MPTQVVSNEEFIPRPQSHKQKQVEHLINTMGDQNAKRLGMERRAFMASTMGLATCFLAANKVFGNYWEVNEDETLEPGAYEDKYPKGEYFVMDVQAHFTNGIAIGFRNQEFVKNMGFKLDDSAESYAFPNFVKEMFFDSETAMLVISGVPGKESHLDKKGNPAEGPKRGGGVLPSWLMSARKKDINDMAGSVRALCQGNCAPNHYWDMATNSQDKKALFEQMQREYETYGIDSWKWYCHTDPGRSGGGFQLDDEKMTYPFYEKSKEMGLKRFSVHKGFSYQSKTLGHLANPKDVEKAALDHPDLTFVIYHSAMQHAPTEAEFLSKYNPETGDFAWHDVLMKIKERNPKINNVYPEIGSSFGTLAVYNPEMCQHLIGRNCKVYGADHTVWGTDCLWWGSPQWVIDAFKRFQITDEMCEKFGYKKLTKEDKANIFGLNAARIYKIDAAQQRKNLPKDELAKLKTAYHAFGGMRDNAAYGWVRDDVKS
ncbi:MAG: amidohydrolase family protein [Planctomycetia bacterium]|nr:amidohydrolase family protein [Planctomycetia bacterium]